MEPSRVDDSFSQKKKEPTCFTMFYPICNGEANRNLDSDPVSPCFATLPLSRRRGLSVGAYPCLPIPTLIPFDVAGIQPIKI